LPKIFQLLNNLRQPVVEWTVYVDKLNEIEQELCKNEATDLVFLIDESGSISATNFVMMTQFVSEVIGNLHLGQNSTRVATKTFSSATRSHYTLSNYNQDLEKLTKKVRSILIYMSLN
jgi:hypothetical protein